MKSENHFGSTIEKDQYGYYAYCPELKGCHSQGVTFEEVMNNIKEAIDLYLETMSSEEVQNALSQEILNTTFEVDFA